MRFCKKNALVLRTPFQQNILLFTPAARGGYVAGDALKIPMFFSFSSLQSGKGAVSKGRRPLADFLSSFLCSATKKGHKRYPRTRAAV